MARLLADENFPLPVVAALRRLGHDVLTLQQIGRAGEGVKDDEVLALAMVDHRSVLTLNRQDFIRLHRRSAEHAGIIVCTIDYDFDRCGDRIHEGIQGLTNLQGQLIRVNRPPT